MGGSIHLLLPIALPKPAIAQLIADQSLGNQSSQVHQLETVDTISGGRRSGSALFHSFLDFNVSPGRSVYFQDPGVSHIFTRVTGNRPSSIQGTLGVLGNANLVLLNPNGILFDSTARLDIPGSFTATTAAEVKFLQGGSFSAIAPQAPPLLTLSVPIGLQLGSPASGRTIINRGWLTVGQDLTLNSDRLDLQGTLTAGRDLTLQATDTLQIRDTPTQPFLALAHRNLELQGDRSIDILALQHPQTSALQSGGLLTLISDGVISGDARFSSQGHLQMRSRSGGLVKFTSLYDPILSTAGDVDLALDYVGPSLLIEAGGNIRIQGRVDITAPDTTAPLVGEDTILNQKPGLI
ncbi:MAG: filamentous hemagglutinin N-terminal domain-containing protein, partial [Synechococcales bacterium]|nr:filamentous hemagglutinin N-terminal domain-containing protein [Synechococcales bacterium]